MSKNLAFFDPSSKKLHDLTDINVRLPTHAIPEKYVIHLTPFIIPDNFTIEGHVSIEIDVKEDANNITLHIKGQEISERNCGVFDSLSSPTAVHYVFKWGFMRTFLENQDAPYQPGVKGMPGKS